VTRELGRIRPEKLQPRNAARVVGVGVAHTRTNHPVFDPHATELGDQPRVRDEQLTDVVLIDHILNITVYPRISRGETKSLQILRVSFGFYPLTMFAVWLVGNVAQLHDTFERHKLTVKTLTEQRVSTQLTVHIVRVVVQIKQLRIRQTLRTHDKLNSIHVSFFSGYTE